VEQGLGQGKDIDFEASQVDVLLYVIGLPNDFPMEILYTQPG
jgi:hypothetical protein